MLNRHHFNREDDEISTKDEDVKLLLRKREVKGKGSQGENDSKKRVHVRIEK